MSAIESLPVGVIEVGERHRALSEDAVASLMASMSDIGLRQPITVRKAVDGAPVLVAGRHRLESARRLDWSHIDCIEVDDDELLAELWEIDENLMRAELSPAQRDEHNLRREVIWKRLQSLETFTGRGNKGFARDTAENTGQSYSKVRQSLARGAAIGPDIKLVAGTSLDKGVELDALARLSESERSRLIARAAAGESVSARSGPSYTEVQLQLSKLFRAWREAGEEARAQFLEAVDPPVFDSTRAAG